MSVDEEDAPTEGEWEQDGGTPLVGKRKWWRSAVLFVLALIIVVAALGWFNREEVANNLIAGQLDKLGVTAQYDIRKISPGLQVIENVVVGDPAHPDLTIDRVEARTVVRFGLPRFSRVTVVRPRLYGTFRGGKLSFGSLDSLIFTKSETPFQFPDLGLDVRDGRGLIETDYGPVGLKAEGAGNLRDGFAGILAATAPSLSCGDCEARAVTLYGKIGVSAQKPHFAGPLRLGKLDCGRDGPRLAKSAARLDLTADPQLDGGEGKISLDAGALALGGDRLRGLSGKAQLTYRDNALVARYDLSGNRLTVSQAAVSSLTVEGSARSSEGLKRIDVQASVDGKGLAMGRSLDESLAGAAKASEGTLAQPVLEQVRTALARESRGSTLSGSFIFRRSDTGSSLVVPQAGIRGGSGRTLLSVSRLQIGLQGKDGPSVTGNFASGGRGLPKIAGRMERAPGAKTALNIRMPEYRAGSTSLELPRLVVVQRPGGAVGFAGQALLSGDMPGGRIDRLSVPIDGSWTSRGGLAVWRKCVELRFDKVELAGLTLARNRLPVCPPRGRAIVSSAARGGVKAAAGTPGLQLSGTLGSSPIRIRTGAAAIAWPGRMIVRDVAVALGPEDSASDFRIARLDGDLGKAISGTFEGTDVLLASVPLDVLDASGDWAFADGALSLSNGDFRLEDRQKVDRFEPLVAKDAALRLADNVITANALLRDPKSMREIVRTDLRHDLSTGIGSADLHVDGVQFDDQLQPDTITYLALGVIANAKGEVRGSGRIDWNDEGVTSTGSFTTNSLDFAAAFGPVTGLSGTVQFTDLLGLVTAPDQKLHIAAINPGIEVDDGVVTFQIDPGDVLRVKGGSWPFLGGTLTLEPTTMNLGIAEVRRYTLVIKGLDAGRFLERIQMDNLSATGEFDGLIPLVFDENGGRIEGGRLTSLPPGGNLSYVGQLTYKDLSAMGNFAFDALKSIDYRQMEIDLDGSLEGEIITRVTFDGLRQGQAARKNFITRQIAKLPIRFKINIRAPFFQLVNSVRSLYDTEYLRDPRTLGLIDPSGLPGKSASSPKTSPDKPIQPPVSEKMP